jgi:hypothetical protein
MWEGIIPRFLSSFTVYIAQNSSCNECCDRRFGGLYLLRVKVGRSPEMVDVRLRGQAISTLPSPPVLRLWRFVLYHFQYCHWLSATVCGMMSCRMCSICSTGCSCVLIMLCRVVPYVVLFDGIHEMRTGEVWFVLQRRDVCSVYVLWVDWKGLKITAT